LAVTARHRRDAKTRFLVPWKGVILAGTGHAPWDGDLGRVHPTSALLRSFIDELNEALPGFDFREGDIARVFAGLLPVRREGSVDLSTRPLIVDHGAAGGPAGLFSLSGVKLTTSREVADAALARAFPAARPGPYAQLARPRHRGHPGDCPFRWMPQGDCWSDDLMRSRAQQAVLHLEDFLLRRSSLGDNPARALALAPSLCRAFGWDEVRAAAETQALRRRLAWPPAAAPDPMEGEVALPGR
jgi:glycerol-3-phosphate dehydrogenase